LLLLSFFRLECQGAVAIAWIACRGQLIRPIGRCQLAAFALLALAKPLGFGACRGQLIRPIGRCQLACTMRSYGSFMHFKVYMTGKAIWPLRERQGA